MNVIITNVGRRGYLVDYFKKLPNIKVFVSDCDRTASGLYGNNDGHFILPRPIDNEKLYVNSLINLCLQQDIKAVLPVIDPEIFILAKFRDYFKNEGITVIVSNERVLDVCFDKLKMNDFLDAIGMEHPKTYATIEDFETAFYRKEIGFPVVIKPILGSGSVDTYFVNDMIRTKAFFAEGMIIQEKLEGIEYGTDTFNSFDGEPLRCVIKKKLSMRSGETDKSITVFDDSIQTTLLKLARKLKHVGNLDCDVIKTATGIYIIDMNPRFGGGYPATHEAGVNLISLLYRLLNGEYVAPEFKNYKERLLVMKEIAVRTVFLPNEKD